MKRWIKVVSIVALSGCIFSPSGRWWQWLLTRATACKHIVPGGNPLAYCCNNENRLLQHIMVIADYFHRL
ncbi:hypothetical protein LU631_24420 [Erwinia tracheiphila]|uniref:hypothetical protein n=1 Tax=Erwinia tracheiphila TaxID=65700 RepID=UPI000AE7362F|nr:hypothetical protein [Erwinia tracheiphila]UIA87756.1 hypothetical protein LU631_24420 [Erwinia tracheiphila]UIA96121.1 hypothetical protein LU633_22860 [Erwinia tracheiphila]